MSADAAPPRPHVRSPGRCQGCMALIPRAAVLPAEDPWLPGRHLRPGANGQQGGLCGPVYVEWWYHVVFRVRTGPLQDVRDAQLGLSSPIERPEHVARLKEALAQGASVTERVPGAGEVPLLTPPGAVEVVILGWQEICAR